MTASPTSRATKFASRDSPSPPLPHVPATSRAAISSATTAAWSPYFRRASSTRRFARRLPSAAAEAPAVPATTDPSAGAHARQVASFAAESQIASAPRESAMPQQAHAAGYRSRSRRGVLSPLPPVIDLPTAAPYSEAPMDQGSPASRQSIGSQRRERTGIARCPPKRGNSTTTNRRWAPTSQLDYLELDATQRRALDTLGS
jgi:hypothetical protein